MRNQLPRKVRKFECGIINLDDYDGPGTHWVAYKKTGDSISYYDSFGNLSPPLEFIKYVGDKNKIFYNYKRYQDFGTVNCGHLCMKILLNKTKNV